MDALPPILLLHGAFSRPEIRMRFVAPWLDARGIGPRAGGVMRRAGPGDRG